MSLRNARVAVAVLLLSACTTSDATTSTTEPSASTVDISPPTTEQEAATIPVATASPTTVTPTTAAPTTTVAATTAAPTTTTVEDQLTLAIDRAQTAMRNCDKAVPQACNQQELEDALVGTQLQYFEEQSSSGISIEGEDTLTWTVIDGPSLKGDDLAVATVCRFDPMVVSYADGSVDDEAYYFLQEWHLLPVGNTWKLSEVVNLNDATTEASACDA